MGVKFQEQARVKKPTFRNGVEYIRFRWSLQGTFSGKEDEIIPTRTIVGKVKMTNDASFRCVPIVSIIRHVFAGIKNLPSSLFVQIFHIFWKTEERNNASTFIFAS